MTFSSDLTACAQIVERGDPDRFAATMAAPVEARERLFPIYAFNVEVARAPWVTQESMIAEMRLQWWRDVLEEIRAGGPVRRHEVATPLYEVIDPKTCADLDALVEARRWDIYRDPFKDVDALKDHLTKTSGHLLLAATRSLGAPDQKAILQAGYAQGVAQWLRAVPALEAVGRVPLVDGTTTGVRALAQDALLALRQARRAKMPAAIRPALLALWQTEPLLRQAVSDPSSVGAGTLGMSPARRHWRLMRKALIGGW